MKPATIARYRKIWRMRQAGHLLREIGDEIGVCQQRVCYLLRKIAMLKRRGEM